MVVNMQLDTRIPLMAQGPQIEPYQNQLARALQVRQLQGRVDEQDRSIQQRNALAGVLGTAFNDEGRLQSGALGRIGQVAPDFVPQYAQLANTQQRLDRQDAVTDAQLGHKRFQWLQNAVGAAKDYDSALQQLDMGVRGGFIKPQEAQAWAQEIPRDPAQFSTFIDGINKQMMTAAQRAELDSNGGYGAAVFTDLGIAQFDKKGNYKLATGPDGKPLRPASFDPATQGAVAGAKTTATKEAENAVAKPGKAIEAKAALDSTNSSLDRTIELANGIMNDPALGRITGIMGMIPNRPGGEAANAQARLNTLKSQIGFAVLQAMRDASKTGGALGAVSDTENKLLQNNIASLENVQDEAQLRQELQKIIGWATGAKGRMSDAYAQQYGDAQQGSQATQAAGPGPAPTTQRQVARRGQLPDGRQVVEYTDGTREVLQ